MKPEDKTKGRWDSRAVRPWVNFPAPMTDEEEQNLKLIDFDLGGEWNKIKVFTVESLEDSGDGIELIVVNTGKDDEGYRFCKLCGAWEGSFEGQNIQNGHHRPYPITYDDVRNQSNELIQSSRKNAKENYQDL